MIAVSDAWKEIHKELLLPETFVEVTCAITETDVQKTATAAGENQAVFSDIEAVAGNRSVTVTPKYATLEHNLWSLDGTRSYLPTLAPYSNAGYVSEDSSVGKITLTTSEIREVAIAGITIVWSSEFNEYATRFKVTARNGTTVVATTTVENNTSVTSFVYMDMNNYNNVVVEVLGWSLPNRRFRVERVYLGHILTFTKNELLSYSHEQTGNLNSAELPKNSITFSVDNTNGQWDPNNPNGLERYLSERQRVTVRYGMDVNGVTEWIKAGTFFLSEWKAPSNGMEASFVARDILEFLMYEKISGYEEVALLDMLEYAYALGSPEIANTQMVIDPIVERYEGNIPEGHTRAEVIQMIANAACCTIRFDREGVLHVERLDETPSGYVVSSAMSYSHPETTLTKPMKDVTVSYGADESYTLPANSIGESQTVDNPVVATLQQATSIALWVEHTLASRKSVRGEFRADPRLDLFDIVEVEGKYGKISPVAIEQIKYTYNGSFKATYAGRVIMESVSISPVGV